MSGIKKHKKSLLLRQAFSTLDGIRTHDLLLRRQALYPSELREQFSMDCKDTILFFSEQTQGKTGLRNKE